MNGFSFPKSLRIRKRSEYVKVYKEGKRITTRYFIIYYLKNNMKHPRLGITVTKKVGKAHIRNRWKRLIREFFRLNRNLIPELDIVITVKKDIKEKPNFKDVSEDLKYAFKKIGFKGN